LGDPEPCTLPERDRFVTQAARLKVGQVADFPQQIQFKTQQRQARIALGCEPLQRLGGGRVQFGMGVVLPNQAVQQFGDVVSTVQSGQVAAGRAKSGNELGFGES
jgi:hypothetical protein